MVDKIAENQNLEPQEAPPMPKAVRMAGWLVRFAALPYLGLGIFLSIMMFLPDNPIVGAGPGACCGPLIIICIAWYVYQFGVGIHKGERRSIYKVGVVSLALFAVAIILLFTGQILEGIIWLILDIIFLVMPTIISIIYWRHFQ